MYVGLYEAQFNTKNKSFTNFLLFVEHRPIHQVEKLLNNDARKKDL